MIDPADEFNESELRWLAAFREWYGLNLTDWRVLDV